MLQNSLQRSSTLREKGRELSGGEEPSYTHAANSCDDTTFAIPHQSCINARRPHLVRVASCYTFLIQHGKLPVAMSVQYNKIRNSEIKLQDVKAQYIPFADDAMVMNRHRPTGVPPAPKRLKKKQCPPTPTDDRLPTKKSDGLITTAPVAVKVPQDTYRRLFDLQLGESDYFTVAEEDRSHPDRQSVVIIKTFTGPAAESQIQAIRRIQHNRFVDAKEFLPIDEGYLVSFEFMPLALCEIARNPLLNDVRLASVVGQVCSLSAMEPIRR